MKMSMQARLTWSHLAVFLASAGLAAALAWFTVEKLYLDTQTENLLAQARLAAAALQGGTLPSAQAEPYTQTSNALPGIHTRLLGGNGAVVIGLPLAGGDASLQAPEAENAVSLSPQELLQRSEIQAALAGNPASAVRRVASAGDRRVLDAAAPVYSLDGKISGIVYLAMPLPPGGLPQAAVLQLAGAVLIGILLAGGIGLLLGNRIARPLADLARAADAVSGGDLDQQVPAAARIAELDRLGRAFNAMTASLRRAERTQNALLADVTHELRTPLTVIKGTIETLEDGGVDDRKGRGPLLASMHRETERLIRLVNELLLLARADAGALKLDLRPLDLGQLARSRCATLAPVAARRGVELAVESQPPAAEHIVLGDADRLARILDNLLDNAIRFAPEGSSVRVALRPAEGEVECSVGDCGPGIPPEDLPFIFDRFYRVDRSRDQHTGGTGLGLAIVKALTAAQGGRVSVSSRAGEGTTFSFRLPKAEIATHLPEN